jgi:hypothetical protein
VEYSGVDERQVLGAIADHLREVWLLSYLTHHYRTRLGTDDEDEEDRGVGRIFFAVDAKGEMRYGVEPSRETCSAGCSWDSSMSI